MNALYQGTWQYGSIAKSLTLVKPYQRQCLTCQHSKCLCSSFCLWVTWKKPHMVRHINVMHRTHTGIRSLFFQTLRQYPLDYLLDLTLKSNSHFRIMSGVWRTKFQRFEKMTFLLKWFERRDLHHFSVNSLPTKRDYKCVYNLINNVFRELTTKYNSYHSELLTLVDKKCIEIIKKISC